MIIVIPDQFFLDPALDLTNVMMGHYSLKLILLSILVPVLAAGATLNVVERIRNGNKMMSERSWLVIGTITMSIGVWAMHFIAMLAYKMHMPVRYDLWRTLASILPLFYPVVSVFMLSAVPSVHCEM